jgi:hypothetical protein
MDANFSHGSKGESADLQMIQQSPGSVEVRNSTGTGTCKSDRDLDTRASDEVRVQSIFQIRDIILYLNLGNPRRVQRDCDRVDMLGCVTSHKIRLWLVLPST